MRVVGVMPLWDEEKKSMWMLPGYFEGIKAAGALPVMLPLSKDVQEMDELFELCDGFLFTGGQDVSPIIYNDTPLEGLIDTCIERDVMEKYILDKAIAADKPVLGICRGIQVINASLGGTLYQDLRLQHPSTVEHHQQPPYDVPSHEVTVIEDSPLYDLIGSVTLSVNSYHHQAVKMIAPTLQAMAFSTDGLIEALYMPDKKFIWAVQWHPEFSYMTDANSMKIFQAFVSALN